MVGKLPVSLGVGVYDLNLRLADGKSSRLRSAFTVTPRIDTVTPNSLFTDYSSDTTLQIAGAGFGSDPHVWIGSMEVSISAKTDTDISVKLSPALTVGLYELRIVRDNLSVVKKGALEVKDHQAHEVVSVAPNIVVEGYQDSSLVIEGINFGSHSTVTLQGPVNYLLQTTEASDTKVASVLPREIQIGSYNVIIDAHNGTTQGQKTSGFVVNAAPPAIITGMSPSYIAPGYSSGTRVAVSGANFRPRSQIQLRSQNAGALCRPRQPDECARR